MLRDMHAALPLRTPELDAKAERLDRIGATSLWFDHARDYRAEVGFARGWWGTAVMSAAMGVTALATGVAKVTNHETRPFLQDPTLPIIGPRPSSTSYPSGHSALSAAAAEVSAGELPEQAGQFRAEAADVAWARVYSDVHFPTDAAAGADLGRGIGRFFARFV